MAKGPKKKVTRKPPKGVMMERLGEARTRPYKGTKGGAVTKVEKPRMTGRQYSGDTIRMKGPQRGVDTFRPVHLSDKKLALEGPVRAAVRSAGSAALKGASLTAAFALSPSTFSYKTGGEAQAPAPKKGEKLMKGMAQVGYGSKTSSADYGYKAKKVVGGARPETVGSYPKGKKTTGGARPETPGSYMPKAKPKSKAFTLGTGAQTPKKKFSVSPSQQGTGRVTMPDRPKFKGNWVGAAPTEMQKRGGAKIKRPNLLSLLRKKKG